MSTPGEEVREASRTFYAGLNRMANGDAGGMDEIWSQDGTTMHPIGGREVGWGKVRESFQQVAKAATGGQIRLDDQIIRVEGVLAYELGVERGHIALVGLRADIDQRVTNIYRKETGGWKIVHHHTDLSPAMVEVLSQLSAKS